jgi:hypothetical protein
MSLNWDEVTHLACGECGIEFYVPTFWYAKRAKDGESNKAYHCPNGHRRIFVTSELERVRQERDRLKQQLAQKDDELLQANLDAIKAEKKHKRLEKRTAAGTCPCCKRTFSNMSRHMKSEHPEFVADHTQVEIPPEDKVVPIRRGRKRA